MHLSKYKNILLLLYLKNPNSKISQEDPQKNKPLEKPMFNRRMLFNSMNILAFIDMIT